MKSQSELNDLKRNWLNDPCWDIEDTEGFEAHREELKAYRIEREQYYEQVRLAKRSNRAISLECSLTMVDLIERLERRIAELEKKVNEQ